MKRFFWLMAAAVSLFAAPVAAAGVEALVVGRITEIVGGELLRYDPDAGEWVALVADAPFGIDDALYTDEGARAEIIIPNGTLLRLDHQTQILSVSLQEGLTHLHLSQGRMRGVSRADGADIEVRTDHASVRLRSGAAGDIAADARQVTVTAVDGTVEALAQNGAAYRLQPGESLSLTEGGVASVATAAPIAWTDWNQARNRIWAARRGSAESSRYLPTALSPYAHELDAYGQWRRVYYSGGHHWLWHPTRVAAGWAPYTHGRWVSWYADPCWIPAEPFGYVTHHYGSWEYLGGLWFWVPPNLGIGISLRYGWYPGRVGWVSSGGVIGWYPLLWNEPWYARRHWGMHSYPYDRYRPGRHHHVTRAVVVEHDHFYRSRSYAPHRHRPVADHRLLPRGGPHELSALGQDRRRFYAKGRPASGAPHPRLTEVARQRVETRRPHSERSRPTVVEKHGPPSPGSPIVGPHSGPRAGIDGRSGNRSARIAPSPRPDRPGQRPGPSGHPDRLDPRNRPEIRRDGETPPKSFRHVKPAPAPRDRSEGKSSNLRRMGPKTIEKPFRKDPVKPGPARKPPMMSPQGRPSGPSASLKPKAPANRATAPRHRIRQPQAPSARRQGAPSAIPPRISPAPGQPGMQKAAVSAIPGRRQETSLSHQPGPSRGARPERPRSLQAPRRPDRSAPKVSATARQRPATSSRPHRGVSSPPQPGAPPGMSRPASRHPGGQARHHNRQSPR